TFIWDFKYADTPWGNPYLALMPDVLHQADVGVWMHIRDAIATLDNAKNGKLDEMKWLWKHGRIAGLNLPVPGTYFQSGARVSAAEHRAVMQVAIFILEGLVDKVHLDAVQAFLRWYKATFRPRYHTDESLAKVDLLAHRMITKLKEAFPTQASAWKVVKVHMVVHYSDAIRRGGLPEEYSTNMYEHFHKVTVKRPYRASNRRQWTESIVKSNQFLSMLAQVESDIHEERDYNCAFYELLLLKGLPTSTLSSTFPLTLGPKNPRSYTTHPPLLRIVPLLSGLQPSISSPIITPHTSLSSLDCCATFIPHSLTRPSPLWTAMPHSSPTPSHVPLLSGLLCRIHPPLPHTSLSSLDCYAAFIPHSLTRPSPLWTAMPHSSPTPSHVPLLSGLLCRIHPPLPHTSLSSLD
ncbi:unnamed protein product, partial [Closterium sp. NIES-65]